MNDGAQSMITPALISIGCMLAGTFYRCGFACCWVVCLLALCSLFNRLGNITSLLSQSSFVLAISRWGKNLEVAFVPRVANIVSPDFLVGCVRCGFCSVSDSEKLVILGLPQVLNGPLALSIPTALPIELMWFPRSKGTFGA